MDTPGKDGTAKRAHLDQVARQTGERMYEEPEIPEAGTHLWEWFWPLSAGRRWGEWGPEPLAWAEIEAWARLNGEALTPWEAQTLKAMDGAYLVGASEARK